MEKKQKAQQKKKAVFVDRDGTLNRMVYDHTHGLLDSPFRPEQVQLMPDAGEFVHGVRKLGYLVVVVTNQPGIAKGTLTSERLEEVNARLFKLLEQHGSGWDALYSCPHHPGGSGGKEDEYVRVCECRKPEPGMLLQAARDHAIDLSSSWMVGDGLNDIQAGRQAGCRTVLVTVLKTEQAERFFDMSECMPDHVAANLGRALEIIASKSGERP